MKVLDLANNYIKSRKEILITLIIDSLRQNGLEANKGLISLNLINVRGNSVKGFIDITEMLNEIVVDGGQFDNKLLDPGYEMIKISTILNARLKVILAAFKSNGSDELDEKLTEISVSFPNLSIRIVR